MHKNAYFSFITSYYLFSISVETSWKSYFFYTKNMKPSCGNMVSFTSEVADN